MNKETLQTIRRHLKGIETALNKYEEIEYNQNRIRITGMSDLGSENGVDYVTRFTFSNGTVLDSMCKCPKNADERIEFDNKTLLLQGIKQHDINLDIDRIMMFK